jgi:hypothetical protein
MDNDVDEQYLRSRQYSKPDNLRARMDLHQRFDFLLFDVQTNFFPGAI